MKGLTDIPGVRVGHASDYRGITGCSVVICDKGAIGGVAVRGSATGTAEIEVLRSPLELRVNAVVLAGGSAFGLEAACGVRRFLEQRGTGFRTPHAVVPIVPCAILYDLGIGSAAARPTRQMGEAAAAAANLDAVEEGAVGAGTGATVGKLYGIKQAMKSGVGSATVTLAGGVLVSALAAVNAFGDVRDPATGKIVAGARREAGSREFADTELQMKKGVRGGFGRGNTTLIVVATNAALTAPAATKLAQQGALGLARAIYPAETMVDGDVVFALSAGAAAADAMTLGLAAAEAVASAVVRAVKAARTLGGVPGLLE